MHLYRNLSILRLVASVLLLALVGPACQSGESGQGRTEAGAAPLGVPARAPHEIVVLGDSLTSGSGLPRDQAYPARLQERLDAEGLRFEVINAGVSGDTSAGGVRRLDWVLEGDVRILIVALGANDGLRGLPISDMKRNLSATIQKAKEKGIAVLLTGMEAPPNQGLTYTARFHETFRELAREHEVVFLPFLLEGVAGVSALNQTDGIHPNAEGARVIADHLWSYLRPMLEAAADP